MEKFQGCLDSNKSYFLFKNILIYYFFLNFFFIIHIIKSKQLKNIKKLFLKKVDCRLAVP